MFDDDEQPTFSQTDLSGGIEADFDDDHAGLDFARYSTDESYQ